MNLRALLALLAAVGLAAGGGMLWGAWKAAERRAISAEALLSDSRTEAGALRAANGGLEAAVRAARDDVEAWRVEAARRADRVTAERIAADAAASSIAGAARAVALRPTLADPRCDARAARLGRDVDQLMAATIAAVATPVQAR